MSVVSFVRVQNSNLAEIKGAIRKSLHLIDFNLNRRANKIIIKPNICYYYHPSTGEVTDPRFVAALIDVFRESLANTSEILVVESDASAMKCKHSFSMLEYDKMARDKGIELINLAEETNRVVETKIQNTQFTFNIPELFYAADLVVNVPKPKYMEPVEITCALKNIFGCNAYKRKSDYHKVLNEAIVFINKQIKTDLVVVDGMVVKGNHTKRLNMVMSSKDPVAADAAVSRLMGVAPRSVKQIVLASRQGLGSLNFSPVGDFSYFKNAFPKKRLKDNLRDKAATAYLRVFQQVKT